MTFYIELFIQRLSRGQKLLSWLTHVPRILAERAMETSPLPLLKHSITIGNSAIPVDGQPGVWQWELFVTDKSSLIESVNFVLHPTFNPPSVSVNKPPFSITRYAIFYFDLFLTSRQGWGTFECTIHVTFVDSTKHKYKHMLVFDNLVHSKDYKVNVMPVHEYREKKLSLLPLSCKSFLNFR